MTPLELQAGRSLTNPALESLHHHNAKVLEQLGADPVTMQSLASAGNHVTILMGWQNKTLPAGITSMLNLPL
ncbi:hypothetical protein Q7C_2355 [Methylophaga frappieri]|uniref:Uncharacterized protein n=1 Tax=Methylophaga frappieri (strain ATCC BAA-2434 / DSM 25690 / JAM7) TaxID=754477 RepID=I1YKP6_METFJ|nr:hypothetical protein Q7C_2355 [Methylophaga frappieri]